MKYADSLANIEVIPTGLMLDKVVPGLPRGKIVEVYGDAGVGKSTLCLQIIANAQKQGLKCLWADVEYSYETRYAETLGVDNKKLGIIRERDAESVLDAIEAAVEGFDIVVLDSIGGLTPRAEIEKGADGKVIGGQAGLVARFCRKIVPILSLKGVCLITINHSFIDIMSGKIMTSGGRKLDYHKSLSVRLKLKPNTVLKVGDRKVGKVVVAEIKKDKCWGKEGAEAESQLIFGEGFSAEADLLTDLIASGEVTKKGNTFYRGDLKLGVGFAKAREALKV